MPVGNNPSCFKDLFTGDASNPDRQAALINACAAGLTNVEKSPFDEVGGVVGEIRAMFLSRNAEPDFLGDVDEKFQVIYRGWVAANRARIDKVISTPSV